MSEISFHQVTKRYADQLAVASATFEAAKGEFLSLLGPSGCGKTTLLRMIAGLVEPDGGTISIRGQDMAGVPPNKRDVAIVFQNYALFPHMTVAENVAFGLQMKRVPRDETKRRVARALEAVRLPQLGHRYPRELSGGQQQRVALARALVCEPTVLLLDEPLAALDKKLRTNMQIELKQLQRDVGVTTIFVTHDQEEALALSDRVIVMNSGEIEQVGTPEEIYSRPRTRFVLDFVGRANVFEGQVAQSADGRVFEAEGLRFSVPADHPLGPQTFAVRPEHVSISAQPPSAPGRVALDGVVRNLVYVGVHDHYVVELANGQEIAAYHRRPGTGGPAFALDSRVWLDWDLGEGCYLEAA
ncbi:MAG: ABC transporter ATP-binding protein [Candidimonas sp.]